MASWTPRGQRRTPAAGHRRGHSHLVTQITAASCHDVTLYSPFIQADEIQGGSSCAFNVQTQIKLESLDSSQYLSSGNVPTPRALHRKKNPLLNAAREFPVWHFHKASFRKTTRHARNTSSSCIFTLANRMHRPPGCSSPVETSSL